jgi:hypothetical protein
LTYLNSNGDIFIGTYKFGKADGDGQYTWKNGSVYIGKFTNGMKHGKGKWMKSRDATSNCYEGDYYMDKKHGYGEFKWSSGNVYKGNYKSDLRNGYGEMYWTDGSVYKGNWVNGIQHGYGKMIFLDGTVNEGIFDHNVFQGPVGGKNSDIENENIDDSEEQNRFIAPRMSRHNQTRNKLIQKSKSKNKKQYIDTEDEEIQEIIEMVKSKKEIKEKFTKKNKSRSKSKSKKKIAIKDLRLKPNPTPKLIDEATSPINSIMKNKRLSIDNSVNSSSNSRSFNSNPSTTEQLPKLPPQDSDLSHRHIEVLTNIKLPKKKKHILAIDPDLKHRLLISSSKRKNRDASVPRKEPNEKIFTKRLFRDREKTIVNTNSLLTHGLANRRSRAGKYSKAALQLQDISQDDDAQNKTITVFPTINNHTSMHKSKCKSITMQI